VQVKQCGALFAKKKQAIGKGGKLQVKLLKYVEGTGKIGDVVMVAPAFFENKLKREKAAVLISDEEIAAQKEEDESQLKEKIQAAKDVQEKLKDFTLVIPHKAGPSGHLFGGISNKLILDELKKNFPAGALEGKQVKITSVEGEDGKKMKHDIKDLGDFTVNISLFKDIDANLIVSVIEE